MNITKHLSNPTSDWMNQSAPQDDIIISSRVRLARNIEDEVFPLQGNEESSKKVEQIIASAFHKMNETTSRFDFIPLRELDPLQRRVLVEKHLISPHLVEKAQFGSVFLNEQESISVMVNEEDHLRIQTLFPGFQLNEALKIANHIDDFIQDNIGIAYHEQLGFITSCPTNLGTGLRASVMMHLPGLVLTNQLNRIIPTMSQFGLVVRGIYGEGSEALGNIFQISNQITLGKSEQDMIEDLNAVVQELVHQEKAARETLQRTLGIGLEDRIFRSFGVLSYSRKIETKEAWKCFSDVRLGIDLGIIHGISKNVINELMIVTQPSFLQYISSEQMHPEERDVKRASIIRERMSPNEKGSE